MKTDKEQLNEAMALIDKLREAYERVYENWEKAMALIERYKTLVEKMNSTIDK